MRTEAWGHCSCSLLEPSQVKNIWKAQRLRTSKQQHVVSHFPLQEMGFVLLPVCASSVTIPWLYGAFVIPLHTAISSPAWCCCRDVGMWHRMCIVKTPHYVFCDMSLKVYRLLHWWPLLMSSRPGSRWQPEQARRHTAESSTASERSSRRKVSGHFGRAREVKAHICTYSTVLYKWFHDWEMGLTVVAVIVTTEILNPTL